MVCGSNPLVVKRACQSGYAALRTPAFIAACLRYISERTARLLGILRAVPRAEKFWTEGTGGGNGTGIQTSTYVLGRPMFGRLPERPHPR